MTPSRRAVLPILGWLLFLLLIFIPSLWSLCRAALERIAAVASGAAGPIGPGGRGWVLMARSVAIASGAAMLALVLGVATAYATTRVAFRGRRLLFSAMLISFFLPGYVYAIAWLDLFSPPSPERAGAGSGGFLYSPMSAALLLGLHLYPWAHLVAGAGFASIDRRIEEAGRLCMSRRLRFAKITIPLVAGVLAACGLFVFALSLKNSNIPELLRQRVFATEILIAYQAFVDEGQAALKGLACVGVSLVALALASWIALRRKRISVEGLSAPWRTENVEQGTWLWPVAATLALAVLVATVVVPLAVLARMAGSWSNYEIVWKSAFPQIGRGLATAASVATVSVAVGLALAEGLMRAGRSARVLLVGAIFVLFALPAPVLDIGLINFWNRPGLMGRIYDSPAMLVLGQTAAFLPIATIGLWLALRRLDPCLFEAAQLAPIGWAARARWIAWPLLRGWIVALWTVIFILSVNDAEAAVLLAPAGGATLPCG